jgi:hypothetical protein
MIRLTLTSILALLLSGCLQEPEPMVEPMCSADSDCDLGENCDEGICWGAPPTGATFAVAISPPQDQPELVLTEIADLHIEQDGWFDDIEFGKAIMVSGGVTLFSDADRVGCPTGTIAARVTFERRARIPGGPAFKRSVDTVSGIDNQQEAAFQTHLPELLPGESYTVPGCPAALGPGQS